MATYVNIQSLTGITFTEVNTGSDPFGSYSWNGTTFSRASGNNRADSGLALTIGSYRQIEIELPAGYVYTGNTRTTVTASANSSLNPYDRLVAGAGGSGGVDNTPPPGTVAVVSLTLAPGVSVFMGAGINDGSPSANSFTWTLEIEVDAAPPSEFWTDIKFATETI